MESANQYDLQGEHVYSLSVIGPGASVGGKSGVYGTLLLVDAWEDGAEEPASEVPPAPSGLILLLWHLLG